MSIAIELKKEHKIKVKKSDKRFALPVEPEFPHWTDVWTDKSFQLYGTDFNIEKDELVFTENVEKGVTIFIRIFAEIGRKKRRRKSNAEKTN